MILPKNWNHSSDTCEPFIWNNNELYLFILHQYTRKHNHQTDGVRVLCVRVAYGYPFFLKIVVLADCSKLNKRPNTGVFSEGSFSITRLSQPALLLLFFYFCVLPLIYYGKIVLYSLSQFSSAYRLRWQTEHIKYN